MLNFTAMKNGITRPQLLLILEMCVDAQERCDQRIHDARSKGDFQTAAYQVQLKEQYEELKHRIAIELRGSQRSEFNEQSLDQLIARLGPTPSARRQ